MHTPTSLPLEVALSKLEAARIVAAEAAAAIAAGELDHAQERIDKAGGKLIGASMAVTEQQRRRRGC
jgi:predicted enzyme related to lactoylglutathione lyase